MPNIINGFYVHSRKEVSVSITRVTAGSRQILYFTDDDDAIQVKQNDPTASMTRGLYGGITVNIDPNTMGQIIFKLRASQPDNDYFGLWHAQLKAGVVDTGTIIVSGTNFKHTAFICIPEKPGDAMPASKEDAAAEWSIICGRIEMWKTLGTSAAFGFGAALG